jgi:hypothetical protein
MHKDLLNKLQLTKKVKKIVLQCVVWNWDILKKRYQSQKT